MSDPFGLGLGMAASSVVFGEGAPLGSQFFADDFNRPDEDLEASVNWTRVGGLVAGAAVRSNQCAFIDVTAETAYLSPDAGSANHSTEVERRISSDRIYFECCCRLTDANNFIGMRHSAGTYRIFRRVAGVFLELDNLILPAAVGDIMRLECNGDQIIGRVNGAPILTAVESAHNTVTRQGFVVRDATSNPAIDNYVARTL